MRKKIKTSVIIPIYNSEKYLDECIESVLNQTQKEIEIILVDDGSTDNSSNIIDEFAKEYNNITVIHQKNQKQGAARNAGFKMANGEFVYFLDSDDYIAKDMLEMCYEHAKQEKLDFLFFDAYPICELDNNAVVAKMNDYDRSDKKISKEVMSGKKYWIKYFKCGGIYACPPLMYIRRDYIKQYDLVFEKNMFYEDMDWIVRMYRSASRVSYFSHRLYYRRYRQGSVVQSNLSSFHLSSVLICLYKLISLHKNYMDKESKQMAEDIFRTMISKLYFIINNIDKDLIIGEEFEVILDLLKEDNGLDCISESLYVKLYFGIEFYMKYLDTKFIKYDELKSVVNRHELKIFNYIRNRYKLEEPLKIGIYGTGKMCDEIFNWYEKRNISIKANVSFIVSKSEFTEYRGYPVYEAKQLADTEFDHIIIASTIFADDMLDNLKKYSINSKSYVIAQTRVP